MRRVRRLLVVALVAGVTAGALASAPAVAAPQDPVAQLSFHSEPGALAQTAQDQFFRTGTDTVRVRDLTPHRISVDVQADRYWLVDFASATDFRTGEFGSLAATQAHGTRVAPLTVMDVEAEGDSCRRGSIRILDIEFSDGVITRLDLVFSAQCDGFASVFGQLRINEPSPPGLLRSDTAIQWPDTAPGTVSSAVPVRSYNTTSEPVSVGDGNYTGADVSSFDVVSDDCQPSLAPGASCTTVYRFRPGRGGMHTATRTDNVAASYTELRLIGPTTDGPTVWDVRGAKNDFISRGANNAFLPGDILRYSATDNSVRFSAYRHAWTIEIAPPPGKTLTVGTHRAATQSSDSLYELNIGGEYRSCVATGSITVNQLVLDAADKSVARFDATFSQLCTGHTGALTGRLQFNSTTTLRKTITLSGPVDQRVPRGKRVTIAGTAPPNTLVDILLRRRGETTYTRSRSVQAGTDGRFSTSYPALNPVAVRARAPIEPGSAHTTTSATHAWHPY